MSWRASSALIPLTLGIFVFCVYILTAPNDLFGNGDTFLRYQTTQALVDQGSVAYVPCRPNLASPVCPDPKWVDKRVVCENGRDLVVDTVAYHCVSDRYLKRHSLRGDSPDRRMEVAAKAPKGREVTIYAPGQIFAMAPLYVLGKLLAHHVTHDYVFTPLYVTHTLDDILGALLVVLVYLTSLVLGFSRRTGVIVSLIFGFGSAAWPDAESMLEHTQVSFFLLLSVLLSLYFTKRRGRPRALLTCSGLAIGCAFLTRYDTGILMPAIPLYLAAVRALAQQPGNPDGSMRRHVRAVVTDIGKDWTFYVAGTVPAFLLAGLWNFARFGDVLKTGVPQTFGEPILSGLGGLTISPGKGLVWYCPLVFLLVTALPLFWRRDRCVTALFGLIVLAQFGLFSNVIYWHGDPAWGPRYVYATLPFLVIPLGSLVDRWGHIRLPAKSTVVGIVAVSLAVQVIGVLVPQYRFWYHEIHSQIVAGEGFHWGPKDGKFAYDYYWDVSRNPILEGAQGLYQITAIRLFGDNHYELSRSPVPPSSDIKLGNPATNYEINNFNLWWMATRDQLVGPRKAALLAAGWFGAAALSLFALLRAVSRTDDLKSE
jgi:hypothetical protein